MAQMRRFNVLVMHRRFGKTVLCINRLIRSVITCQRPMPRVAYFAPFKSQAKKVAWDYVKYYTKPIPGVRYNNTDLYVDLPNDARFYLAGADNPDSARGAYLDDVVLDEFGQMAPAMFGEVIRPMLSDRLGGCTFIGTPKGKANFYSVFNAATERMNSGDLEWYTRILRASETGVIPDDELNKLRGVMSEAEYMQEYECSWLAAIKGAYWGRELQEAETQGRLGDVPYIADYPVHTCWDLGLGDALIIWFFQNINGQLRFLECREYHQGLPDVCSDVNKTKYKIWGNHIFPHDISVGELGTGLKRWDIVRRLLKGSFVKCKNIPRRDGIEAVRVTIPRMAFDAKGCATAFDACTLYRADYDEIYNIMSNNPVHDWTSHYADALRYGVVYMGGYGGADPASNQLDFSKHLAGVI